MKILKLEEFGTGDVLNIPVDENILKVMNSKGIKEEKVYRGKYLKQHLGPLSDVAEAIIEEENTYRTHLYEE